MNLILFLHYGVLLALACRCGCKTIQIFVRTYVACSHITIYYISVRNSTAKAKSSPLYGMFTKFE